MGERPPGDPGRRPCGCGGGVGNGAVAWADPITYFTAGDLVISVEGNGSNTGTYADNSAAPITLDEFGLSGTSNGITGGTTASLAGSITPLSRQVPVRQQ